MPISPIDSLSLPEDIHEQFQGYLRDLKKAFSRDLEAMILFGSAVRGDFIEGRSNLNLLVLVKALSMPILQRAGGIHAKGGKHQIVPPLFMTVEEMSRSCSLYPLEWMLMKESHLLLEGRDPFPELHIPMDKLGWHCEREIYSHVVQVRQRLIEGEARPEAVPSILILSITALLPLLRGLLHVLNQSSRGTDREILERLPQALQYQSTGLLDALLLKRGMRGPGAREWFKEYEAYLEALMELTARVQELRVKGQL
ncbi:MAG: hypothetical protein R3B83_04895 [Nitrospirales bacterium]|nr:hypothetical protein [Nitrospirales bacterium]